MSESLNGIEVVLETAVKARDVRVESSAMEYSLSGTDAVYGTELSGATNGRLASFFVMHVHNVLQYSYYSTCMFLNLESSLPLVFFSVPSQLCAVSRELLQIH